MFQEFLYIFIFCCSVCVFVENIVNTHNALATRVFWRMTEKNMFRHVFFFQVFFPETITKIQKEWRSLFENTGQVKLSICLNI